MADLGPVTCLFVLQRLNSFLDREVDEATADLIRQHISQCEECSDEAECWMMLRQVVRRAYPPSTAPPDLIERVNALIDSHTGSAEPATASARSRGLNRWERESPAVASGERAEAERDEATADRLNS
ncbi:MAG: zf-HC2 domain-containing protein [Propionibacteriaceae bacterium]|jgi:anti-sigma factor (TIGR02949 family)|nr:zf-HC2 domain-containing protein [Propionibacteriaceae bacterium]